MKNTLIETFEGIEARQRLLSIYELVSKELNSGNPILTSTYDLLTRVKYLAGEEDEMNVSTISLPKNNELEEKVIISCDASIKQNPGGPASIGYVIQYKNEGTIEFSRLVKKSVTINQAEYDAVYIALTHLVDLKNNPGCLVEIRTDSKLVVNQLLSKWECNDEKLKKKRDNIWELTNALPFPVTVEWRPRCSTKELERADALAKAVLGIK